MVDERVILFAGIFGITFLNACGHFHGLVNKAV
jgi:hypothetical protein